jgi:hypothetical protein
MGLNWRPWWNRKGTPEKKLVPLILSGPSRFVNFFPQGGSCVRPAPVLPEKLWRIMRKWSKMRDDGIEIAILFEKNGPSR